MAQIASEKTWGVSILLFGLVQLLVTLRGDLLIRWVFAFLDIFIWMTILLFFALGNYTSTGVPVYFVFVLIAITAFTELGVQRR